MALAALALVALGCAQVQVTTRTTPGAEWSGLRTYSQADAPTMDPVVAARIRSEIASALAGKGYASVPADGADLIVAFRGSREERSRLKDAGDPDATYYVVQNYEEGTLVIDVFEASSRRLLWHGVGRIDIFHEREVEKAAARAVKAVLAEFPPAGSGPDEGAPPG